MWERALEQEWSWALPVTANSPWARQLPGEMALRAPGLLQEVLLKAEVELWHWPKRRPPLSAGGSSPLTRARSPCGAHPGPTPRTRMRMGPCPQGRHCAMAMPRGSLLQQMELSHW